MEAKIDSDTNDINDPDYQRNNTPDAAQLVKPSAIVYGFVTKNATGVAGQRFVSENDEIDFYRASLITGQQISLEVLDPIDENGIDGGNDLDFYLLFIFSDNRLMDIQTFSYSR